MVFYYQTKILIEWNYVSYVLAAYFLKKYKQLARLHECRRFSGQIIGQLFLSLLHSQLFADCNTVMLHLIMKTLSTYLEQQFEFLSLNKWDTHLNNNLNE